jgi:hypothetical protein
MTKYSLPAENLLGVEFFRFLDLQPLNTDAYFKCLNSIKSLLKSSNFQTATPGFYVNRITNVSEDNGNSLRLTYYTTNASETLKTINAFVEDSGNGIKVFNSESSLKPDQTTGLDRHDEEELRFRNFLNRNTQICLDVLENYGEHSFQELVTSYRYIYLPQRIPPGSIFDSVFGQHSNYFNELKKASLNNQYWEDLTHLHRGKDFGLHFMVNMVAVPESEYHPWFLRKNWVLR